MKEKEHRPPIEYFGEKQEYCVVDADLLGGKNIYETFRLGMKMVADLKKEGYELISINGDWFVLKKND